MNENYTLILPLGEAQKIRDNRKANIVMYSAPGVVAGEIDFSDGKVTFKGNVEESAKLFFESVAKFMHYDLFREREEKNRIQGELDNAKEQIADLKDELEALKPLYR